MSTVLLLSTSDTDLLAARASGASYRIANPTRVDAAEELPDLLRGVDVAVVRLLGGRRAWEGGLDALKSSGVPTVLLGGEAVPDAELMAESSVPSGVVAEALKYLVEGGPENLRQLACFLSDTVLMSGEGFEPPAAMPEFGVHGARERRPGRPTVGVLFYRAHELAGNTAFVDTLCEAIEDAGGQALPLFCASLRAPDPDTSEQVPALDDSMRAEVRIAGELMGRPPKLEIDGDLSDVPVGVADHARAALREALSNVVRHAGARTVLVRVRRSDSGLRLQVVDDGCGIPRDVSRRGLRNLAERAVAAGGRCDVASSPDSGTTVTWEVPLAAV